MYGPLLWLQMVTNWGQIQFWPTAQNLCQPQRKQGENDIFEECHTNMNELLLRCSSNGTEQRIICRKLRFGNCIYTTWLKQTAGATCVG